MAISPVLADGEIKLMKDEYGGLMMEEGIATISFYEGEFAPAVETLKAQFAKVVAANPWLTGRLAYNKEGGMVLQHSMTPSGADVDSLFMSTSASEAGAFKLSPSSPYQKICRDMYASKKVVVQNGYEVVGKKLPVALLTLSESEAGKFALIFSLSHVVGDGKTYYEVFKMLQPGAAITSLKMERMMNWAEANRDIFGRKEMEWSDSTSAQCMYECAMMPLMCGCSAAPRCVAFHLDQDRVAAAKKAASAEGDVPYVTTNDILTSGFFTACGSRIGIMGLDTRGRMEGIEKDLAGNYATALTMDPGTFSTPAKVRKMLTTTPYQTTMMPLPSCCGWFVGRESAKFAMATNWSTFAGELITLEGCEMKIHLPVLNPDYCLFDLMIPFSSSPGKFGVICYTVSSSEEALRAALPVGDKVSPDLFP